MFREIDDALSPELRDGCLSGRDEVDPVSRDVERHLPSHTERSAKGVVEVNGP